METSEVIVRLIASMLLGSYLFLKHRQRVRLNTREDLSLPGKPLDATTLTPRLKQIREDYSCELPSSRHASNSRANLIHHSRQALGCLEYFRGKGDEHEHPSANNLPHNLTF